MAVCSDFERPLCSTTTLYFANGSLVAGQLLEHRPKRALLKHYWFYNREIVRTGILPNITDHQFYPTPEALAQTVNDLAEIDSMHSVLEPSAGLGNLLVNVPVAQVTCVDISPLHCLILKEKNFSKVIRGDFLELDDLGKFDRVLMNPPFSMGRAETHLIKAFGHLKAGDILVAVLLGSMHNKKMLEKAECQFTKIEDAGFEGTKVCVTTLRVVKLV